MVIYLFYLIGNVVLLLLNISIFCIAWNYGRLCSIFCEDIIAEDSRFLINPGQF